MDNSFILSHLPQRLTSSDEVAKLCNESSPPTAAAIAEAIAESGRASVAEAWLRIQDAQHAAEQTLQSLKRHRISAVGFWSNEYPNRLRFIPHPPWTLFFIGALPQELPTLAVVGSRYPNNYGEEVLGRTVPKLATRPLQIVSGLAYGVDSLAHFHACESKIPNFAVLGCGVDVLYPPGHEELAQRILDSGGGILSEYPPETQPRAWNFPRRNRIISGLANLVWIVQGSIKSGSLHTAKHALAQDKIVAATPGEVFSELSELPNRLIYDGAFPVHSAEDIDLLLSGHQASSTN